MASRATLTMTRPPARLATISSVWATAGRGNAAHASKNRNALLIGTFQRPPELGGLKLGYSFAESPGGQAGRVHPGGALAVEQGLGMPRNSGVVISDVLPESPAEAAG